MYGDDLENCTGGQTCSAGKCRRLAADRRYPEVAWNNARSDAGYLAQPVEIDVAGNIVELLLATDCTVPVTFYGIRADGSPDGIELARTRAPVQAIPSMTSFRSDGWASFALQAPLRLTAGQAVVLVLDHSNCDSAAVRREHAPPGEVIRTGLDPTTTDWFIEDLSLRFALVLAP